jgi:hypothetical protein
MGGTVTFYGQPRQQQANHNTKNQLFLFRQAIHVINLITEPLDGKPRILCRFREFSGFSFPRSLADSAHGKS